MFKRVTQVRQLENPLFQLESLREGCSEGSMSTEKWKYMMENGVKPEELRTITADAVASMLISGARLPE